jgi:predicted PurR-regulated permease PerM
LSTESGPFQRYWRPLLILGAIVLVIWLITISMAVLVPFLVGILLAYLTMPLITRLEKILPPRDKAQKAKRAISIIIVFIVFAALFVLFAAYMGAAMVSATTLLLNKAPEYITQSMDQAARLLDIFRRIMPLPLEARIEEMIAGVSPATGKFIQDFVVGSMAMIPASMPTVIGFITLPFFLFFVLYDYESFQLYFYDLLPAGAARHTGKILGIIGDVMGRYIRAQIILGLIVGTLVFLGLLIVQVEYAPAIGVVTALTQFIPVVGPVVSGLMIVIVTLALQPDKLIWALLVFIIAEGLLNVVFLNLVQGKYMQIHPAIVMVLLVVGGYIAGFWGMIMALPVCATAWELFKYFLAEQQASKLKAQGLSLSE